jgi:hypothetical protein
MHERALAACDSSAAPVVGPAGFELVFFLGAPGTVAIGTLLPILGKRSGAWEVHARRGETWSVAELQLRSDKGTTSINGTRLQAGLSTDVYPDCGFLGERQIVVFPRAPGLDEKGA